MGKIYIKTINGRKYRYERISAKRIGGSVITKDNYLGAVDPVTKKMGLLKGKRMLHYRNLYEGGCPVHDMVKELWGSDGIKVSETTVRNFFKQFGVVRGGK